ncbi:nucleoprotein [Porcine ephemerovirus 1]|uniref:Nucleoprotein n=1 Tax=Porcine ephemerovirus 1 TaxID=2928256 RepID=A0AAX3A6W7_9RHAB|nr:nucleoprotein [Porcine ephemerovirus 1]UNP42107.1 nucleoprotein [Porcine ephemerovirus 1]
MYCTVTDSTIKPKRPYDNVPAQFPLDYFKRNNHTKPNLRIPQKELGLQDVRELVRGGLNRNDLNVKHAMRYLYLVLSKVVETADDDWDSFGIKLVRKGCQMTPWDLFNIVEDKDKLVDGIKDNKAVEDDDKWMCLAIVATYRLGRTNNQAHKNNLIVKINQQLVGMNRDAPPMIDLPAQQAAWVANADFNKMIAGIDMFFNKFKTNEWAFLRFGTIPARYKDCAALMSIGHLCDVTGLDLEDVLDWIFVGTIATEIVNMMTEGNEVDNPYSYMPYMMELGLSMKSPYSSSMAPGLYTLVHMVGCLLYSDRSKNARMISDRNLVNIKMNAEVLAFVRAKKGDLVKAFVKENEKNRLEKDSDNIEPTELDLTSLPSSHDPMDWFAYLESVDFNLPDEIKLHTKSESRKITNTRAGTIGHHIATTFI